MVLPMEGHADVTEPCGKMHLSLFLEWPGRRHAVWRMATAKTAPSDVFDVYKRAALRAERAKLDAVFVADVPAYDGYSRARRPCHSLEAMTTVAALAASTTDIGLIATASTTFLEPYHVARFFSTIDHISNGRVGWNIVTSLGGSENFNVEYPSHDDRYRRAREYMEVVTQLWDSWDDDAVINDKESARWALEDRIHPINFSGAYYRAVGPLHLAPSPQRYPVLVQAGASAAGMDFAAAYAELVFTIKPNLRSAQEFRRAIKARAAGYGRDPSQIKVTPGLQVVVGESEAAARELDEYLTSLSDYESARAYLRWQMADIDIDDLSPTDHIPLDRLPSPDVIEGDRGRYIEYYRLAVNDRLTVGELTAIANSSRGHFMIVGDAEQVADRMEEWFTAGGCDGFMIQPYDPMGGVDSFVDLVVPILQDRGLFREEYEGRTLRNHLGLRKPSQHAP